MTAKERLSPDCLLQVGKVGCLAALRRTVCVRFLGCIIITTSLVAENTQLLWVRSPGSAVRGLCSRPHWLQYGVGWAVLSSGESAGEAGSRFTQIVGRIYFPVTEGPRTLLHHWISPGGHAQAPPHGSVHGHFLARLFTSARPSGGSLSLHQLRQSLM